MKWMHLSLLSLVLSLACSETPNRPSLGQGGGAGQDENAEPNPNSPHDELNPNGQSVQGLSAAVAVTGYPRLSHSQWENSVRDLLRLPALPGLAQNFPPDPSGSDFDNNGDLLKVSESLWAAYRDAAETLGDKIGKDPSAYKKLIPSAKTDTKSIVTEFLRNAYRRTPSELEITDMVALFNDGTKITGITDAQGAGFDAMISFVLQSPYFIYRIEVGDQQVGKSVKLTAFEVASRLSYAAWNSMPDPELLDAAASGQLLNAATLKAQAKRLLADPRGEETLKSVHMKAFKIDSFSAVPQDTKQFPEAATLDSDTLRKESELFVKDVVVTQGKGVSELLTAPYAFVSAKTAAAYGIPSPGPEPKKTSLDPTQRAGLLTQVGFLSNYSFDKGINAIIKRGHYVSERLICAQLGAPPPPPEGTGPTQTFKTDRERVAAQTAAPGCAACHAKFLNPFGFAFENLGPAGKWRTAEPGGEAINASDSYAFDDETIDFDGPVTLMKKLSERADVHQCYVRKMVEALYGRGVDASDANLIGDLGAESLKGLSSKDIFIGILSSKQMGLRTNK